MNQTRESQTKSPSTQAHRETLLLPHSLHFSLSSTCTLSYLHAISFGYSSRTHTHTDSVYLSFSFSSINQKPCPHSLFISTSLFHQQILTLSLSLSLSSSTRTQSPILINTHTFSLSLSLSLSLLSSPKGSSKFFANFEILIKKCLFSKKICSGKKFPSPSSVSFQLRLGNSRKRRKIKGYFAGVRSWYFLSTSVTRWLLLHSFSSIFGHLHSTYSH